MRNRLTVMIALASVLALMFIAAGCDDADFITNSKKSLLAAKNTWEDMQDEVARQYLAGELTVKQLDRWRDIDAKFRASHTVAVKALKVYVQAVELSESNEISKAKAALLAAMANLDGIIATTIFIIETWKGGNAKIPNQVLPLWHWTPSLLRCA